MINDSVYASGKLSILLVDSTGAVKQKFDTTNLVVTVGKNLIASRLGGNSQSAMTHMAVGTNAASPITGNTTLGAEIAASRITLNVAGGTVVDNNVSYAATFPAGVGTGAVTELGIFNASVAGVMLCRTTFPVVNKATSDVLTVTWNVTIS